MKKIFYGFVFAAFAIFAFAGSASAQSLLTYNLKIGMKADAQVLVMQNFLMSKGFLGSGNGTGNFGPLTFSAVQTYQGANGIDTTGFVGPITRSKINSALSGGGTSTSYVSGCTSLVGFSPLTGQSCASGGQSVPTNTLTVSPVQVSNISGDSAYLSSSFSAPASSYFTVRFEYTSMPTGFVTGLQSKVGQIILTGQSGTFSASMANLPQGQTYYVRAVAEGGTYGTVTSNVVSFTTGSGYNGGTYTVVASYQNQSTAGTNQPLVGTNPATSVTDTNATLSGVYDGRGYDTSVYFQYWYGQSALSSTNIAQGGTGAGSASFVLSNLVPGITYSYRMVAVNGYGTSLGSTVQFSTTQPLNNGGYTYNNSGGSSNACAGALPNVTASLDSSTASGFIGAGQAQVPLMSARISNDCDASLKSLTFASAAFSTLSGYAVYLNSSTAPLAGTFSGATFTLATPVLLNAGSYNKVTLKANTPAGATGTVQFGLINTVAQSSSGVTNQYSTSVAGNTLTYATVMVNSNPSGGGPSWNGGGSNGSNNLGHE